LNIGVRGQRVDGFFVAVHNIEDTVGKACLGEEFGEPVRGRGVFFTRLQNDRVTGGDCNGEAPQWHHGRKVEGADDAHDTKRLAQRVDVDASGDVFGIVAVQQLRHADGKFHDLEAAGDFPESVVGNLAVLRGQDVRQLALASVEQLSKVEHDALTLGQRGVAPGGESGRRRSDRNGDITTRLS
jgi:hypothetical protein